MDNKTLNLAIAARRADADRIATEIIIECERAATRKRFRKRPPAEWSRAAWSRYLGTAAEMQYRLGRRLDTLYVEIESLESIAAKICPA